MLDRTSARFFEVTAYATRGAERSPGRQHPGQALPRRPGRLDGWGEHTYNNRIRAEKQRHLDAIARELFAIDRANPAHGIVVAAPGQEAGALEPFLHNYLVERLLGTARLNPKDTTLAAVHGATLAVREAWERAAERNLVHEMIEAVGSGWAVNGMTATLRALSRGRPVRCWSTRTPASPASAAPPPGGSALTERDCRGEGDPIPVLDVVDDAIEEALRQGVDVNVVYEPEARDAIDGLGALLRFR